MEDHMILVKHIGVFICALGMLSLVDTIVHAQQWNGAANPKGAIWRPGNVAVGEEPRRGDDPRAMMEVTRPLAMSKDVDDQPCYLSLWGRMVDPRYKDHLFAGRKVGEFQLAKCNVKPEKKFLKGKDVSIGELDLKGGFIRSVRVCQYGGPIGSGVDTGELKGIRILPAIVSASGDVTPKDLKPKEQPMLVQPHCPKDTILANDPTSASGWDYWVSCPADQVLTGLQVYHREKQITALDVRCKRVGWFTAPKEPVQDLQGY